MCATNYNCTSLTSLYIPKSVTNIGERVFRSCTSLTEINVDVASQHFTSREGVLFTKNLQTLLQFPEGKTCERYNIPAGVQHIAKEACRDCRGISNVTAPNTLTDIGESAFYDCHELISINLPESLTNIGESAFYGCAYLTAISIPNLVTTIKKETFDGCGLETIVIGKSMENIGERAFGYCRGVTSITFLCTTPPECGDEILEYIPRQKCTLYVPKESLTTFRSTMPWSRFPNIVGLTDEEMLALNIESLIPTHQGITYTLGGQRLPDRPAQKGIYIIGGRKTLKN